MQRGPQADHIVMLDRGTVLEEGSHAEPMAGGRYAELYNIQAWGLA